MKLLLTERAENDLSNIADYLRGVSPTAALRVRDAILDAMQILSEFPGSGRLQSVETIRKVVVRKYPYLVYYTVDELNQELVVLAVQHAAQQRPHQDK